MFLLFVVSLMVLILVVMEDGLILGTGLKLNFSDTNVLILVVMDNGLVHNGSNAAELADLLS